MSLINDLLSEHGSELIESITSQLGLNQDQAKQAVESVAPMVLNGLKSTQDTGGANAVSNLLEQLGGSENILGNISNLLGGNQGKSGSSILGSLLGGSTQGSVATNALGEKLGIDSSKAGSIISMLVPVIMGFLSKQGRQDPTTPDTQSGISAILDRDGDGSAIDDITALLSGNNNTKNGGLLGSIVGGLLGGKR